MPSESSKGRMLALAELFTEETDDQVGLSMPQIIEKLSERGFDVERKAVYRDLRVLRDFGYDIQKYQRHPVEYGLATRGFDEGELMALIDAVQSSRFMTERQSKGLVTKLKKMSSARQRKRFNKQLHVGGRIKMKNESVFLNVDVIQECMAQKRKVTFRYFEYDCSKQEHLKNDGERYVATPVGLLYVNSYYYLVAYSDDFSTPDHMKNFRVDRMKAIGISEEAADRNQAIATFDSAEYESTRLDMFAGDAESVTLLVKQGYMNSVIDRFGQDVKVTPAKDGESAKVYVSVAPTPVFWGWLATFEGGITVAAPQRVRSAFADYLKHMAKMVS